MAANSPLALVKKKTYASGLRWQCYGVFCETTREKTHFPPKEEVRLHLLLRRQKRLCGKAAKAARHGTSGHH